jgi:CheY-like chemotaxis protein
LKLSKNGQIALAKTILVIEDSADIQMLYRQALELESYAFTIVGSASEALQFLKSNRLPDLILTDLTLPEMDGSDLIQLIRANPLWADAKIVAASGRHNLQIKSKEAGADGFIKKPFDLDKLYDEIEKYLKPN